MHKTLLFAGIVGILTLIPAGALPKKRHPPVVPKGHILHPVDNRATVFYTFQDKNGQVHKLASVTKTVTLTVVRPGKPAKPTKHPGKK